MLPWLLTFRMRLFAPFKQREKLIKESVCSLRARQAPGSEPSRARPGGRGGRGADLREPQAPPSPCKDVSAPPSSELRSHPAKKPEPPACLPPSFYSRGEDGFTPRCKISSKSKRRPARPGPAAGSRAPRKALSLPRRREMVSCVFKELGSRFSALSPLTTCLLLLLGLPFQKPGCFQQRLNAHLSGCLAVEGPQSRRLG